MAMPIPGETMSSTVPHESLRRDNGNVGDDGDNVVLNENDDRPAGPALFDTPLQDYDVNQVSSGESIKTGFVPSSKPSVLHRPRPKASSSPRHSAVSQRLSKDNLRTSLFSIDTTVDDQNARRSSFFFGGGGAFDSSPDPLVATSLPSPSPTAPPALEDVQPLFDRVISPTLTAITLADPSAAREEAAEVVPLAANRHSFYGLDDIASAQTTSFHDTSLSSSRQPSTRDSPIHERDSGSASHSSIERGMPDFAPRHSATTASISSSYRQSQLPHTASRAASIYAMSTVESTRAPADAQSIQTAPLPPLLDQSHLKVGPLATLLSHGKTLDLYRANARKTSDPDVQFEFAIFCLEVVGEMDAAKQQKGTGAGSSKEAQVAEDKKSALVSESIALLSKLATRGHVKSQYFLADCYTQGVGTAGGKRDYAKAFPLFVLAGKHGHPEACFRAAQCCEFGWGCRKDASKAVQLYKRGAIFGHPESMHRLGLAELNGELGMSKKPKDGVKWLKRAADMADQVDPPQPVSLHELALLHEKGIENVIFKDEEYAAELLARASEMQYAPSAYKLGECYEYGKMGCPKDSALSIHYYNIAAQQNHREACFALTAWYLVGSPGVLPQSDTEAYLWALKAAEMGLAKAQYAVGYFTESGIGTFKDARESIKWYQKAARQGDKRAVQKLRQAGKPVPAEYRDESPPEPPSNAYKPPRGSATSSGKKRTKGKRAESADRKGTDYRGRATTLSPTSRSEGGHDRIDDHQSYHSASIIGNGNGKGRDPSIPDIARPDMPRRRSVSMPDTAAPMPSPLNNGRPLPPGAGPAAYSGLGHQPQRAQLYSANPPRLDAPLPRMPDLPSRPAITAPPSSAPYNNTSPEIAFTSRMLPPGAMMGHQQPEYGAPRHSAVPHIPGAPMAQQQLRGQASSASVSAQYRKGAAAGGAGPSTLQREPRRANKDEKDCVIM